MRPSGGRRTCWSLPVMQTIAGVTCPVAASRQRTCTGAAPPGEGKAANNRQRSMIPTPGRQARDRSKLREGWPGKGDAVRGRMMKSRGWGIRRYTRHVRAFFQTLPYRKHLDAILAMGESAMSFYRELGFKSRILFPFIYQSPFSEGSPARNSSDSLRLVYAGKFDRRKGIKDLFRALGKVKQKSWTLDIIGDGRQKPHLNSFCKKLGIEDSLNWKGSIQHEALICELSR